MVQSHFDPEKETILAVVAYPYSGAGQPLDEWSVVYEHRPGCWAHMESGYESVTDMPLFFFFTNDDLAWAPDWLKAPEAERFGFDAPHIHRTLQQIVRNVIMFVGRLLNNGLMLGDGADLQGIILAEVRYALLDPRTWKF